MQHDARQRSSSRVFKWVILAVGVLLLASGLTVFQAIRRAAGPESRRISQDEAFRRFGWVPETSKNHYVFTSHSSMNGDGVELLYFELSPKDAIELRDYLAREYAQWQQGSIPAWVAQNYQGHLEKNGLPSTTRLPVPAADNHQYLFYNMPGHPEARGGFIPNFDLIDIRTGRVWYWHWSQ